MQRSVSEYKIQAVDKKVFSVAERERWCHCAGYHITLVCNPCIIVETRVEIGIGAEKNYYSNQGTVKLLLKGESLVASLIQLSKMKAEVFDGYQ